MNNHSSAHENGQRAWPYTEHQIWENCDVDTLFRNPQSLGQGSLGFVEALESVRVDGYRVARKKFILRGFPHVVEAKIRAILYEAETLKSLDHPHVVAFIGSYEYGRDYSLLMHPVGDQDLGIFLAEVGTTGQKPEHLDWIRTWFTCLLSALAHIHDRCFRHEDIKPSNIVHKDHRIYLTDFGSTTRFDLNDTTSTASQANNTACYAAPESRIHAVDEQCHSRRSDIFSLGCVFVEMLTVLSHRSVSDLRKTMTSAAKVEGPALQPFGYCLVHEGLVDWFSADKTSLECHTIYETIVRPMLRIQREARPYASTVLQTLSEGPISNYLACHCTLCNNCGYPSTETTPSTSGSARTDEQLSMDVPEQQQNNNADVMLHGPSGSKTETSNGTETHVSASQVTVPSYFFRTSRPGRTHCVLDGDDGTVFGHGAPPKLTKPADKTWESFFLESMRRAERRESGNCL